MAAGGGGNIGINVTKVVYIIEGREGSKARAELRRVVGRILSVTKVPSCITRETEADAARIAASGLKPKLPFVSLALDLEQLSPRVREVATHVPQVRP